jgi:XTP/dITP diphosphohydrolase
MRTRLRLVVATLNRAKGREVLELLRDAACEARLLADLVPDARLPEETGETYRDNALIKARAAAALTGELALADDSGIEVDALDGAPGVRSARFGGPGLDDPARTALLLEQLRGVPIARRTARYRCVIALVWPDGTERTVEGTAEGIITTAPRGGGGFGYDPVFEDPERGRTFAELTPEAKAAVSHRGRAVRAAVALLGAP